MERFLIVRLGAMGDIVHGLPAVALLRERFPQAHIGWLVEKRWSDLLGAQGAALDAPISAEKPLVNEVFEVNTKSWRKAMLAKQTRVELQDVLAEVRHAEFDVCLDLQGSIKSAVAARLTKIDRIVGPAQPREFPARWLYTQEVNCLRAHVVEQYAELVASVSGNFVKPAAGSRLLPVDRNAEQWRDKELRERGLEGWRYAVLSPGAGWKAKEWPAKHFADLARQLTKDGIRSLVNVGPSEVELGDLIQEASGGHAQPIRCNISQLIALLRKASLFVGGDTGPMHMANLLSVPVVALFGPTDPARNGPYFQPSSILRDSTSATTYSHKKVLDAGIVKITVEQVLAAARNLTVVKA